MSTVRELRHQLLNQVNHIVGYTELLLEETEDRDPLGDGPAANGALVTGLGEICAAGREVMAAVTAALDPAGEGYDAGALATALAAPLGRIRATAAVLSDGVGDEAADVLGRIAAAAERALGLASAAPDPISLPAATHAADPGGKRAGVDSVKGDGTGAQRGVATPAAGESESGRGLVLVVDDDADNRDVLQRRLTRLGYQVIEAGHGGEALERLAALPVDLMLLDLDMPGVNGYGVLEARQGDRRLRDIPVVMISASADVASMVRCIEMGADDHLGKPFDPVLLEARVGACLEKKRLRDQERELLATVSRQAEALAEWNEKLELRVADQVDELERMTRLRRFLSPQLADLVVSGGREGMLQNHRRDIAVLFVDLSGFTAFSETSEPEDVMAALAEFHGALGALVDEFEATVGFFAGDGLMVFFNDPLPCPAPAERAVRMALAMRARLDELVHLWRKRGYELGFAIGVSYGYATLGEIGFEGRFDYGVIGSVVNLAARLCDRAEPGQILVSARVKLAVEDVVDSEEVGAVTLKGFHAPVPAYNLTGLRGLP